MRFLAIVLCLTAVGASAQSQASHLRGDWKSKAGSIVRIESCGDRLCMRLVQILNTRGEMTDSHNPNAALRNRPLCGLQIGSGFTPGDANHATGGTLYDPKSGKSYRGNITAENATLHLRGYIGISLFGESQDWTRDDDPVTPCEKPFR